MSSKQESKMFWIYCMHIWFLRRQPNKNKGSSNDSTHSGSGKLTAWLLLDFLKLSSLNQLNQGAPPVERNRLLVWCNFCCIIHGNMLPTSITRICARMNTACTLWDRVCLRVCVNTAIRCHFNCTWLWFSYSFWCFSSSLTNTSIQVPMDIIILC